MTHSQQMLARAIDQVTYCPGIGTKRFARDMAELARNKPDQELTTKQVKYMAEVAIKFRRQIPADIVALARLELAALEGQPA